MKLLKITVITLFLCFHFADGFSLDKNKLPIDSSVSFIDSVLINLFIPSNAEEFNIAINHNSIKISTEYSTGKTITNSDTLKLIKNYVGSLFISGREKTEIGRSYSAILIFKDYIKIKVHLFEGKENYLTQNIHLGMENYRVEFSETFNEFYKLLLDLCKQIESN